MDREKMIELKKMLDELVGDNEPSDEDLDFDEDAIEVYDEIHNLRQALENCGF